MDASTTQTETKFPTDLGPDDDTWVATSCALCYGSCSIRAHRKNGVVVKIEGNPDSAVGKGRLCGKGISGIMSHYDPGRVQVPLRRTNPEKGVGVDPGWQEISWDEALDEVCGHLKRVHEDDPRKLVFQRTTTIQSSFYPVRAFLAAFGTNNSSAGGGGLHCGNGAHLISGIMHASWSVVPDFERCDYAIYFGASKGHGAGHASCSNMKLAADARVRGMRLVVVDPMCNFAAAKAGEWVPIRVGTDAALALSMCNILVNELGTIDVPYLQAKTNAPYLIGPDKKYVRDSQTGKPLVWDQAAGAAVPFDSADPADLALEGEFEANGVTCRPGFALLKEHLKTYTAERGAEITSIPAADIRRIAEEFAAAAKIGSVTVIDGVSVPYRPAAAIAFRGSQGHKNSTYNMYSIDLLNQLVGSADVAGGCLGFNPTCHGHPDSGRPWYQPNPDPDGMMITGHWMGPHFPFPLGDPQHPKRLGLQDLFPMSMISAIVNSSDQDKWWDAFEFPYRPEVLINYGTNLLMSIGNSADVIESLKKFKFMVSFDVVLNETSAFADIVLPDCGNLQQYDSRSNFPFIFSHPGGMGDWSWPIRQPVVAPVREERLLSDVLLEIADRIGIRADMNAAFNAVLDLKAPNSLDYERRYDFTEVCDADLKDKFGDEHDLEWFKENGVISWPKKPEEVYWRAFVDVRVPVYLEWMTDVFEQANAIAAPRGMEIPAEHYSPLPDWLPCPSHECDSAEHDLYAFYYRDTLHTNSYTMENPWLDEAARLDPFSYTIAVNEDTGREKGLKSGDAVRLETDTGLGVDGRLRLTQAIHPEGVGIAALAGHWADTLPVAKGKGVFFNDLLALDWEHSSPSNLNLDLCAKVKITRLEA
ncbi:MAG: molybdopterin-dependent oxidoreductase [Rhodospirillales bacterium]|nr:molybdopterin-binding protein [Rhodospirillaceae bacterium]MDP6428391.1 molybdopterin-dependent oxidoreductase [Rhodospirillales bacterium]MDP6642871.1 molybdopterin-dependent oxidoreductase [Rhodospirillales bacterium]MDP6841595.1 molybdopterin-dependent oxidoreductase [Rhodospirillales bacterium]